MPLTSQVFSAEITLLYVVYFCYVSVVLGHSWQYVVFEDRYSKNFVSVTKKKSMALFINPFISAYDSTVQDLTA